jgi:iron complex outermembrane receptor protein
MRRAVAVGVSLVALAWAGLAPAQDAPAVMPTTPSDDNAPWVDGIIATAQGRSENHY